LTRPAAGSLIARMRHAFWVLLVLAAVCFARAGTMDAAQLAQKMSEAVEDGDATARVRLKSGGEVLQLQVKSRRRAGAAAVSYEVLWPAARKGERFVLRQTRGGAPSGESGGQKISGAALSGPVFGSDLAYADVIENFFRWGQQSLTGTEPVGKIDCAVLESRAGRGDASIYGKVKTWIDMRRMVPLRVEKYDKSGRLVRRIDTTQVAKDDMGRHVPAGLTVQRVGAPTVTEIEGTNIRHDVRHEDGVFLP